MKAQFILFFCYTESLCKFFMIFFCSAEFKVLLFNLKYQRNTGGYPQLIMSCESQIELQGAETIPQSESEGRILTAETSPEPEVLCCLILETGSQNKVPA